MKLKDDMINNILRYAFHATRFTINMSRMDQVNELLKNELGILITREIMMEDGLITIIRVDCSPNLQHAAIYISVLPNSISGTALKNLRQHNSIFSKTLRKKLNLRTIPKLNWKIDAGERYAAEINDAITEIANKKL